MGADCAWTRVQTEPFSASPAPSPPRNGNGMDAGAVGSFLGMDTGAVAPGEAFYIYKLPIDRPRGC